MSKTGGVLVVDDDEDVRESVAEALRGEGFEVSLAASAREALDQLAAGLRPAVILLDLLMPEMDGWAFRAEQNKDPAIAAIPTLVFTAGGETPLAVKQLGAQGFLKKPLSLQELVVAVGSYTRGRRSD